MSYENLKPFYVLDFDYNMIKKYDYGNDYNGKITITVLRKGKDTVFHWYNHVTFMEFYTRDQSVFMIAQSKVGCYRAYNKMMMRG